MTKDKPMLPWMVRDIELWSIEDLLPYARNSRTHSDEQVQQVVASMRKFGWTFPVLVAEDGTILAGHCRILAGRVIGLEQVPVIVARGWTDAQKRAYVIADNKLAENAGWDLDALKLEMNDLGEEGFDLDVLGFSISELDKLLDFEGGNDAVAEWEGMPEFDQPDKTAFRTIPLHFKDQEAVDAFAKLINQTITDKTRFAWYPEIEIDRYADKRYEADAEVAAVHSNEGPSSLHGDIEGSDGDGRPA